MPLKRHGMLKDRHLKASPLILLNSICKEAVSILNDLIKIWLVLKMIVSYELDSINLWRKITNAIY